MHFESNSSEGDIFVLGMMNTERRWQRARHLFTKFIEANGFSAWHIHDGWVMNGYDSGNILHHEDIRIVWIGGHAGHSHTWRCPDVGEAMVVISDSPDGDEIKPFTLYCYEVAQKRKSLQEKGKRYLIRRKAVTNSILKKGVVFFLF